MKFQRGGGRGIRLKRFPPGLGPSAATWLKMAQPQGQNAHVHVNASQDLYGVKFQRGGGRGIRLKRFPPGLGPSAATWLKMAQPQGQNAHVQRSYLAISENVTSRPLAQGAAHRYQRPIPWLRGQIWFGMGKFTQLPALKGTLCAFCCTCEHEQSQKMPRLRRKFVRSK